jgi:hypothetical protein
MSEQNEPKHPTSVEILTKMTDLATAGFGLVAALAWNEAIKSLFALIFPSASNVIAQFTYAIFITAIIVIITLKLGKLSESAKQKVLLKRQFKESIDKSE